MAVIIKINLIPAIRDLKNFNLRSLYKNVGKDSVLLRKIETIEREWSLTLKEIENIAQRIASEGINPSLLESARSVTTHCEKIARMAGPLLVEGGSFIPGPIGIVCSLALAIADFAVGNFFGGFMNLLCCVPFAKAGCKVLLPTLKKIVADILKNPYVKAAVKSGHNYFVQGVKNTSWITAKVKPEAKHIYENMMIKKSPTTIVPEGAFLEITSRGRISPQNYSVTNYGINSHSLLEITSKGLIK